MASYRSVPRKVRPDLVAREASIVGPLPEPKPELSAFRKADLVALAAERGLDTSGTKADLVERLA